MRTPSPVPARSGEGWWHLHGGLPPDPSQIPWYSTNSPQPVLDTHLHTAYAALLRELPLSPAHRDQLRARGLDDDAISHGGCGSLPLRGRSRIARYLARELGEGFWCGVPGFFINSGGYGDYLSIAGSPGLVIPIRDPTFNLVIGLTIRPDAQGEDRPKYVHLSSAGKRGGTPAKARVHLAQPRQLKTPDLYITEGPLKAQIVAELLGARALGLPGVGSWRMALPSVAELNPSRVVVGLDADWRTKPAVRNARDGLAAALSASGVPAYLADWDPTQGKGLDDLLAGGGQPSLEPVPKQLTAKRLVVTQAPHAFGNTLPDVIVTPDEAQAQIVEAVKKIVGELQCGVTLFADTFGVGKTRGVVRALLELRKTGRWPKVGDRPARVAFLTDTTQHATVVAEQLGISAYYYHGRTDDEESPGYCFRYEESVRIGGARQNVFGWLCAGCKARWAQEKGRPEEEWRCRYVEQQDMAKFKPIHVMAKPKLITPADTLDQEYDVIVLDEDILSHLLERVVITRSILDHWIRRMDESKRFSETAPERVLVRCLQRALAECEADAQRRPLRQYLPEVSEDLLDRCSRQSSFELSQGPRLDRLRQGSKQFEEPVMAPGVEDAPLRAFLDLVAALKVEVHWPAGADTRIWIEPARDEAQVVLYLPRANIVEALKQKPVLLLDATPDVSILERALGQPIRVVRSPVDEKVCVTQFTDSLYTKQSLKRESVCKRVAQVLDKWQREPGHADTNVLTPLQFEKMLGGDGHWGRHDRMHNDWENADSLAIVGHWQRPLDEAMAVVQAWRHSPDPAPQAESKHAYKPYQYRGADGEGHARLRPVHPDPEVQTFADRQRSADIRQAIGRLRPCRRRKPVDVLLMDGDPVVGLPIAELSTARKYLGQTSPSRQYPQLALANDERHRQLLERVYRAAAAFHDREGRWPGVRQTQRELIALGYPAGERGAVATALGEARAAQSDVVRAESVLGSPDGIGPDHPALRVRQLTGTAARARGMGVPGRSRRSKIPLSERARGASKLPPFLGQEQAGTRAEAG